MDDEHKDMVPSTPLAKNMRSINGVVTSIDGSNFTVEPIGHEAPTTVFTDEITTFRVNGQATSSAQLEVGVHVALIGTVSPDTSITASMVSIFNKGFSF